MGPFKSVGVGIAAILGTVLIVSGLVIGGVYWSNSLSSTTAEPRGEKEMRERTKANGAFRQATTEEFYDLCAAVQTAETQIKTLKDELDTKPSPDRAERIRTSLMAAQNTRAESINTYNSKATQEHREALQSNNLPARLDVNNEVTTCAM